VCIAIKVCAKGCPVRFNHLTHNWKVFPVYTLKNSLVGKRKYSVAIAQVTYPLTHVKSSIRPRSNTLALHFVSLKLAFVSSAICPDIFAYALKMIFTPCTRVNVSIIKSHDSISMAMGIQQIPFILSGWETQPSLVAH
jgi:hypothetical protein